MILTATNGLERIKNEKLKFMRNILGFFFHLCRVYVIECYCNGFEEEFVKFFL